MPRQVLLDLLAYWRRPVFITQREALDGGVAKTMGILLFALLLSLPLQSIIIGTVFTATGQSLPDQSADFSEFMQRPDAWLLIIVLAPLFEELMFRAWMGAVWGVLLVLPCIMIAVAVFTALGAEGTGQAGFMIAAGLAVIFGFYAQRYVSTQDQPGRHRAAVEAVFPYIFWGGALIFGLFHLSNYEQAPPLLLGVVLVLPQLLAGLVLGYVRMRYGILPAIGFHGAYNGALLGMSMLAMQAAS